MPYIGMKHAVFAPFNGMPAAGSLPTYLPGVLVANLIGAQETIEYNDSPFYADDTLKQTDQSFKSGRYTVNAGDLTQAVKKLWFGMRETIVGGATVLREAVGYESPYGGFGFYRKLKQDDGTVLREAHWYYKTKWRRPNTDAKTRAGSVEWQTVNVEGIIAACDDAAQTWHDEAYFATDAEAEAWLDTLAGIVTPEPLALANSVPVDDAPAASKTANIVLTFNNVMNRAATAVVLCKAADGTKVALTPSWDETGKILTLAHAALSGTTEYILAYRGVDGYGQTVEDTLFFTTAA